jgi:hypothetical protein
VTKKFETNPSRATREIIGPRTASWGTSSRSSLLGVEWGVVDGAKLKPAGPRGEHEKYPKNSLKNSSHSAVALHLLPLPQPFPLPILPPIPPRTRYVD